VTLQKQIERQRWPDFFVTFSNGNRGRPVVLKVDDPSLGISRLVHAVPLMGVDYDPVDKGDDIVVTIGRETVDFAHTITAPLEVVELQDESGAVTELDVVDESNSTTRVMFVD